MPGGEGSGSAEEDAAVALVEDGERLLRFSVLGQEVRVDKVLDSAQITPLFGDGAWDVFLWECSIFLANQVARHPLLGASLAGTRCVELGAGVGAPGLAAAALGADVVLTDRAAECKVLRRMAGDNFGLSGRVGTAGGRVSVCELDWGPGAAAVAGLAPPVDVVLACECVSTDVYGRASWAALETTLRELVAPGGLLVLGGVRRPGDGLDEFLALLARAQPPAVGFRLEDRRCDGGMEVMVFRAVPAQ